DKNEKTRVILGRDNQGNEGKLVVMAANGKRLLEFDPASAALYVGADGNEGDLILQDSTGQESVKLDGGGKSLRLGTAGAPRIRLESGNAWLGGNGDDGDLIMFAKGGDNTTDGASTVRIDGATGDLRLGGNGTNGDITLQATDGSKRVRLQGGPANFW